MTDRNGVVEVCDCCGGTGMCDEIGGDASPCMNCCGSGSLRYSPAESATKQCGAMTAKDAAALLEKESWNQGPELREACRLGAAALRDELQALVYAHATVSEQEQIMKQQLQALIEGVQDDAHPEPPATEGKAP